MKEIGISNFRLAAYIVACGHSVTRTMRNGRRLTFIFDDHDALREDINLFRFGNPPVLVHDLTAAQSRLREMIFDDPMGGGQC